MTQLMENKLKNLLITPRFGNIFFNAPEDAQTQMLKMIEYYQRAFKEAIADGATPYELMRAIYDLMDEADKFEEYQKERAHVQCRKGCAFCCHIQVELSEFEARALLEYCARKGIDIDYNHLTRQKDLNDKTHPRSSCAACVFLKNNLCSVYEFRPVVCRTYYVVTPPALCDCSTETQKVLWWTNLSQELIAVALDNIAPNMDSIARMFLKLQSQNL